MANWVVLLYEKHLEMIDKYSQFVGSEDEDLFQAVD